MRRIYCKSNIYYRREFQLETSIVKENNQCFVIKKILHNQAREHLYNMEKSYYELSAFFPNFNFCDLQREKDYLIFDFVEGESVTKKIIEALSRQDKNSCINWIKYQIELIDTIKDNTCAYYCTEEFKTIFGDEDDINGVESYKKVSFDMTTNNFLITLANKPVFIDYEWYFEFPIPKDLVKYHIIITLINNIEGLSSILDLNDLVKEVGIVLDLEVLHRMWSSFYSYIFLDNGYNYIDIKNQYLQKSESVTHLKEAIKWHNNFKEEQDNYIKKLESRISVLNDAIIWHNNFKEEQDNYIALLRNRISELETGIDWHHRNDEKNEDLKNVYKKRILELENAIKWHNEERTKSKEYIEMLDSRTIELENELNEEKSKNSSLNRELFKIQQNTVYRLFIGKRRNKE